MQGKSSKNRDYILLDPIKDKTLLHIFNDLRKQQVVIFDYSEDKEKWKRVSRKIGVKCKDFNNLKNPFIFPTSSARWHNLGFVTRPKTTEIEIVPFKGKQKIIFNHKIF